MNFARIVHADWSTGSAKRWAAEALRDASGWRVDAPRRIDSTPAFVSDLVRGPSTLTGFDFPIGLPFAFGQGTGLGDFPAALGELGHGDWARFFDVAERAEDISARRPFYPRAPGGKQQVHLTDALGVSDTNALRRRCELATSGRRAACPLFWTLGGNQVGKAAISGWREVVLPARRLGAKLWPFEGSLEELGSAQLVIAETYPAEAYGHVGVRFAPGASKTRQGDRRSATEGLIAFAERHEVSFTPALQSAVSDGFGTAAEGEDAFDAAIGLLGMIEVVAGRRLEGAPLSEEVRKWEGWILGQRS